VPGEHLLPHLNRARSLPKLTHHHLISDFGFRVLKFN
jgi:hypothetical protein